VLLGKGEKMNDGRGRDTIFADLFEALIGAVYLDSNLEVVREVIMKKLSDEIQFLLNQPLSNWKAELQDYSQKKYQKPPQYRVIHEAGPDHSKVFHIVVVLDEKEAGHGIGSSKKEAEQAAAEHALSQIR
jgi:ribonuclease-3